MMASNDEGGVELAAQIHERTSFMFGARSCMRDVQREGPHGCFAPALTNSGVGEGRVTRDRLIDGWRGASALFVVIGHTLYFRLAEQAPLTPLRELSAAEPSLVLWNVAVRALGSLTGLGVSLFFVIGGYLITSLLIDE